MALKDYEAHMVRCERCSYCKFVPWTICRGEKFTRVCPAIERYTYNAYSATGRYYTMLAFLMGRLGYSPGLLDITYRCQTCGACDVGCKYSHDMEPLEAILEFRFKCVEDGQVLPANVAIIDGLRKEDNMLQRLKAERGKWAEELKVKDLTKEKAEVYYHAGCRFSYDEELWPVARGAINLLSKAGVDVGIRGKDEMCCGGLPYEMGYPGESIKYVDDHLTFWTTAGVKTVVTSCSDCYQAFKVIYHKIEKKPPVEVLHITEYLHRLIKEGKLKLTKAVPMRVTYHDPCHLGRLGEPWIPWKGVEKSIGLVVLQEPPKVFRRGVNGVYEPPRDVLKSISGLRLVEMERIRDYAWCCGSGGGVKQAFPDFALWTASQRIEEAKITGAEAIVTACGWCERNFKDAIKETGEKIKVYDVVELVEQAI